MVIFSSLTGAGSSDRDYNAIRGNIIQFNTGDGSKTFSITINQDSSCEDDPNEYFYSTLSLVSPTHRIRKLNAVRFSHQLCGMHYVCFKLNSSISHCGL